MYENVKFKLHRELDRMDERYMPDNKEMSMVDLEVIEKAAHALKCLKAIEERPATADRYNSRTYEDDMRRG